MAQPRMESNNPTQMPNAIPTKMIITFNAWLPDDSIMFELSQCLLLRLCDSTALLQSSTRFIFYSLTLVKYYKLDHHQVLGFLPPFAVKQNLLGKKTKLLAKMKLYLRNKYLKKL